MDAAFSWLERAQGLALKSQQIAAIGALINKRSVITQLPTGFGKSLIFIMTPLLMDLSLSLSPSLSLSVCVLKAHCGDLLRTSVLVK